MAKTYRIMGKYQGRAEEVDTANSQEEADHMLSEYRMAFGTGWNLWIE